jgi:hypothetical protein
MSDEIFEEVDDFDDFEDNFADMIIDKNDSQVEEEK